MQNPHLTSLPSPRPTLLVPDDVTLTTGTAEIFRAKEVQDRIIGDFIVLPCDLLSELSGTSLLECYMTFHGAVGGSSANVPTTSQSARNGALGVWYETQDIENGIGVKKEETDFLAVAPLSTHYPSFSTSSIPSRIQNAVLAMPSTTLSDVLTDTGALRLRPSLLRTHPRLTMLTSHRDAHIYFLPHWSKTYLASNDTFTSIGEDALGVWAKATWQAPLFAQKAHLLPPSKSLRRKSDAARAIPDADPIDLLALSSTGSVNDAAARVPPLLAYVHPSLATPGTALVRRIDTVALLLSASVYLARLPTGSASPFAQVKTHPSTVHPAQSTIETSLLDAGVTLASRITIKDSVVGAGTSVAGMCRLQRCLLMEGVVLEEKVVLSGCVLGRRCRIGKGSELRDCAVQEGFVVPEGTVAKGEVLAVGVDEGEMEEEDEMDLE